jgi:hypothetical protein
VIHFCSKTNEMHQFFKFILFCSSTLHILDGLSFHHQESKTVHTASGICERDSAHCLLAGTRWNEFIFATTYCFNVVSYGIAYVITTINCTSGCDRSLFQIALVISEFLIRKSEECEMSLQNPHFDR